MASSWKQTILDDQRSVAEELPLRRDVVTMLIYLHDNKVTGTQSTGNLPLKAVYEICARFVNPPKLEDAIGEHVYRVRSKTGVWPSYFKHLLASVRGLITGGLGRCWKLTTLGERFLASPAPLQVWLLLATWWTQTNWAVAFPYDYEHGNMPSRFSSMNLTRHLAQNSMNLPLSGSLPSVVDSLRRSMLR